MTRRLASVVLPCIAIALLVPSAMHAQTPAPAPSIDVTAWVFGSYNVQTDDAAKAANGGKDPNKFDINRAYLTFRGPLGDRVSFRITTDIKQGGATADYKGWFVRLKYAYLQYDWLKPTKEGMSGLARTGLVHNVIIDHEELFWPRFLIQTGTDRLAFFSSADLGVAAQLNLPNKLGEIYGTVVNGTGYEAPEANVFKDYGLRLSLTPLGASKGMFKTLAISPWFYAGGNASKFFADATHPIDTRLARNRYGIFVGNRDRRFTFGGDFVQKNDDSEAGATPLADVITGTTGKLWDGFVIVRPLEFGKPNLQKNSIGLVLRYDHFTPNNNVSGDQTFLVAGIMWEPTRKAALALDYQTTQPQNGLAGTTAKTWFLHYNLVF
jgi:hypothetical protein